MSLCFFFLFSSGIVRAQTSPNYQRVYPRPVAEVRAAVQNVKNSTRGRLPTLEGFVVDQANPPLDRYDKGFYECSFDVAPAVGGGTLVVATTKITAFLNDPTTGVSGYRVLTSNGRLENDALDSIEEVLNPGSKPAASSAASAPPAPVASATSGGLRPARNFNAPNTGYGDLATVSSSGSSSAGESSSRDSSSSDTTRAPRTPVAPAAPLPTGESVESLRARALADAKKSQELTGYIQSLEEIEHNQARPANLAAVKKPKTPVYTKAAEGAPVLLSADAQDEFEVLEVSGPWVHVRISGASRGWIRRTQLEMPAGYTATAPSTETATNDTPVFRVAKEETNPFSGSWDKLKGKTVRVEWIEASSQSSSPAEKLAYAKSVFLNAYQSVNAAHQNVDGIVVVFDSADGGQIAAALSSVKALADKSVSDSAFWRQCSLDPADAFQTTETHARSNAGQ
ncbi:MAG: hypothetical protein WA823_06195 [Candidatus Acidiferrales bacterium]